MIKLLRVDQRLLHGQVAVTWVGAAEVDAILVANDEIMKNEMSMTALKLAKPSGVGLAIRSVEDGIELLKDPRSENSKILVLTQTVDDALRVASEVDQIKHINIGGVRKTDGAKLVQPATYINAIQAKTIEQLLNLPHIEKVEFRTVPSEKEKDARAVIKNIV